LRRGRNREIQSHWQILLGGQGQRQQRVAPVNFPLHLVLLGSDHDPGPSRTMTASILADSRTSEADAMALFGSSGTGWSSFLL
jgi:hypothetical protein